MTEIDWKKIKVGDTITVRALHFREGRSKATRKVTEVGSMGIGVRLYGWNPFYLRKKYDEIIEHIPLKK